MKYAVIPLETERERIYQEALCLELAERKLAFEREKSVNVNYKGVSIPGQRIDLIVGGCVIVELKAVATLHEIHEAKERNVFVPFFFVLFVPFVASILRALRGTPPRGSSLDIR